MVAPTALAGQLPSTYPQEVSWFRDYWRFRKGGENVAEHVERRVFFDVDSARRSRDVSETPAKVYKFVLFGQWACYLLTGAYTSPERARSEMVMAVGEALGKPKVLDDGRGKRM